MSKIRKILYPLSLLYGEVVNARNKAYEKGVLNSTSFTIPTIVVGNLNVGGTGKSPQIEYLVRLLKKDYRIAVLSRGYKRKSKGFQLANENSTSDQLGDEPFQFYKKFNNIIVAVDADRVNGINQLQQLETPPEVILLDDAFQHRKVNPGFTILLTDHQNLYVDDSMLPSGNLREKVDGAKRAQVIVVSKCPEDLNDEDQFRIAQKLQPELNQTIFFSAIEYHNQVVNDKDKIDVLELEKFDVLLVTGIAKPKPLEQFLNVNNIKFKHLKYPDHHDFTESDKKKIRNSFESLKSNKKIILTTEKDYVRNFTVNQKNIYYLPIKTKFLDNEEDFNKLILNYVQQNAGNS